MDKTQALISTGGVERRIVSIRGIHVMLDVDLAALYRVETRVLVQAVKRNTRGVPGFDITARILAEGPRWSAAFSVCLHRAGRRDALERPAERGSG
jgi:ORF6N domain